MTTMRILEISPAAKRKAAKVVAHAKKRANWYNPRVPGWMSNIPGNDRRHQCKLNTFRCVFSYTVDTKVGKVMRHLSVSVPSKKWPNPVAIKEIAKMFGFTGAGEIMEAKFPEDWYMDMKEDHQIDYNCIVIAQDTRIKP